MIPALTIAVSGLIDATNRANTAASNIVRKGTVDSPFSQESRDAAASYARAAGETGGTPAGTGSTASLGGQAQMNAQMSTMPRYIPSMAEDMVMMREAVHAYKANASVIRQLDRTTGELLDVLRTDKKS